MSTLTWYYPKTFKETAEFLKDPGVVPHGGGTGILRSGTDWLSGLVDLRHLPVFDFKAGDDLIELGAGLTFSEVVQQVKKLDPESILVKSLSRAAATPLRNRITVGGSVAMAPVWSDLLGPLVALDAEVVVVGVQDGIFKVVDYVSDRSLRSGSLVKAVQVRREPWKSYYFRATATRFDYAGFTITALAKTGSDEILEDLRLVVVGSKKKFQRLSDLESRLVGHKLGAFDLSGIGAQIDIEFSPKTIGSPEYVRHLFEVELERALLSLTGQKAP